MSYYQNTSGNLTCDVKYTNPFKWVYSSFYVKGNTLIFWIHHSSHSFWHSSWRYLQASRWHWCCSWLKPRGATVQIEAWMETLLKRFVVKMKITWQVLKKSECQGGFLSVWDILYDIVQKCCFVVTFECELSCEIPANSESIISLMHCCDFCCFSSRTYSTFLVEFWTRSSPHFENLSKNNTTVVI